MNLRGKWNGIVLFNLICLIATGCGGGSSDQPDLGSVTGSVAIDGKPLPNAMVVFSPENGRSSMGITDSDGNYELTYVADTTGAKIGKHSISITNVEQDNSEESGGESPVGTQTPIPAKYNTKSTLTEEVKAGDNTFDFELTSK